MEWEDYSWTEEIISSSQTGEKLISNIVIIIIIIFLPYSNMNLP